MQALEPYVTHEETRHVVNKAPAGPRLTWAMVRPLFGIALMTAAQQVNWIDEAKVRELIDRATGPEQRTRLHRTSCRVTPNSPARSEV
jgi:hypothetical protein